MQMSQWGERNIYYQNEVQVGEFAAAAGRGSMMSSDLEQKGDPSSNKGPLVFGASPPVTGGYPHRTPHDVPYGAQPYGFDGRGAVVGPPPSGVPGASAPPAAPMNYGSAASGYAPTGGTAPGYAPTGGTAPGYAPTGGTAPGYAQTGGTAPGYAPTGGTAPGYAPTSGTAPRYAPAPGSPHGYAPAPSVPQGYPQAPGAPQGYPQAPGAPHGYPQQTVVVGSAPPQTGSAWADQATLYRSASHGTGVWSADSAAAAQQPNAYPARQPSYGSSSWQDGNQGAPNAWSAQVSSQHGFQGR